MMSEKTSGQGAVERGKGLFSDPALGGSTNEKSCNSCHPGGKGLEHSGQNSAEMVNKCIKGPLAGKALEKDSQEMEDILAYMQSLKK
jgi:cytochrome c